MTSADRPHLVAPTMPRNVPLGALRTLLTLLVVAHHAVLAYHPYAPPPAATFSSESLLWNAFPIVDAQRWPGIDLLVGWNDTFFMALMFLVSGLFVWSSLERKGSGAFVRDRARRLGLPFLVSAALLAPLAYYPTYFATGADPSLGAYVQAWLALGVWPAGPAWFLWLLLAFDVIAGGLFLAAPAWGRALGGLTEKLSQHPIRFFAALVGVSALAYLPMAALFSPETWGHFGPFWVQSSRALHYAVYFIAGIGLGAAGLADGSLGRGLLAAEGPLARRWLSWSFTALAAFAAAVAAFLAVISTLPKGGPDPLLAALGNLTFVLCCACSSFAALAFCLRFARRPNRLLAVLGANAYGIYIFHYAFVSWLQLALLDLPLAGAVKGTLVFTGAVVLSLGLTAALRRVPAIRRVI